jgi:methanethiol S-methyltransferase
MARRIAFFVYGVVSYFLFVAAFLYAVGFVGNFGVPKGIDDGEPTPLDSTLAVNLLLLGLFAVQHSVMARPAFKRWWTTIVPEPIERSTYVLLTSLALLLLYWQWRPMPAVVWDLGQTPLKWPLVALSLLGWLVVFTGTFMIDHFELFGLKQVWYALRNQPLPRIDFTTKYFYRFLRHPLMLGFIIAFWATPTMSQGHLLFAAATTIYILVAIQIEEHDLMMLIGDDYRRYRTQVPMLIPLVLKKTPRDAEEK